ncbi:hypothetical protein [Catenuloplanes japonicus]|uniref:hypothetical protein n=1 Tax=Catenuloplanes japonicus TaxID=33876 RepID=UPI0005250E8B|nr:hypothetical protein [Catenuloplanes japonicus]
MTAGTFFTRMRDAFNGPPPTPPQAGPVVRTEQFAVTLPSSLSVAVFDAEFTIQWYATRETQEHRWQIRRTFQHLAQRHSPSFSVNRAGDLEIELNLLAQGSWRQQTPAGAQVTWTQITVTASDSARAAAESLATIARQAEVDLAKHRAELDRLQYLRDDVLARPAVARSYWLERHKSSLNDLLDERFELVAAKFGSSTDSSVAMIAGLLEKFLTGLDADSQAYLLGQLGIVFASYDREDLARELER